MRKNLLNCHSCRAIVGFAALLTVHACRSVAAKPDPVAVSDESHAVKTLSSRLSTITVEVLEANLHRDLKFMPDGRALYYRVLHGGHPVLHWSRLGIKADACLLYTSRCV